MDVSLAELIATAGVIVGIISGVVALVGRWNRAVAGRIDERTRRIIEEMRPNDGSTLRDRVDRIEAGQNVLLRRQGVTVVEVDEELRTVRTERTRRHP